MCIISTAAHIPVAPYTKEVPWGLTTQADLSIQVCNVKVWQINILSSRRFEVEDATIEG